MNASMRWIVWGTIPLGSLLGGSIATASAMHTALWVGAIGGLLTFLLVLLSSVRSIARCPSTPTEHPTADAGLVVPTTPAAAAVDA